jgi:hypothetical protein
VFIYNYFLIYYLKENKMNFTPCNYCNIAPILKDISSKDYTLLSEQQELLKNLEYLYNTPLINRNLYSNISKLIIESEFISFVSSLLAKINSSRLLNENSLIRDIFIQINLILISYADDNFEFRQAVSNSSLLESLIQIIRDSNNSDELETECVYISIRSLYNVTRIQTEIKRYKKLGIANLLLVKMNEIKCEKTKICAILCLSYTLQLDELEKIQIQKVNISVEEGVTFTFGMLRKALDSGNKNKENMFQYFLSEKGKLPYFWAHELAEGIGKWANNILVRNFIAKNSYLFNWLTELYLNGNVIEKEMSSYGILKFSFDRTLMQLIGNNRVLLNQIKLDTEIDSEVLLKNLTRIRFRLAFHPDLNSIEYLKQEYNLDFNPKLFKLQILLDELKSIHIRYNESVHLKLNFEILQKEITQFIINNVRNEDDSKKDEKKRNIMINMISIRIKSYINNFIHADLNTNNEGNKSVVRYQNERVFNDYRVLNKEEYNALLKLETNIDKSYQDEHSALKRIDNFLNQRTIFKNITNICDVKGQSLKRKC